MALSVWATTLAPASHRPWESWRCWPLSGWLLLVAFCQQWHCAPGWGSAGHLRIAQVASQVLQGKQKDLVHMMLKGDLVDFADWESKMTAEHPETDMLHWHRQEPEWNCSSMLGERGHIRCDGHGAENGSLFCALAFFFDHFAHDARLQDYPPAIEPANTPSELVALKRVTGVELTPAHYLRWLIALIGDLHQPLHSLRAHEYGRTVKVSFRGEERTLLEFWEDHIIKDLPKVPDAKELSTQFGRAAKRFSRKTPIEHFRNWAREAATMVCTKVYGKMSLNQSEPATDNVILLEEALYEEWVKIASDFTRAGGLRVAQVLLDILKHKKHKEAHTHGQGRWHRWSLRTPLPFLTNLAVGVFLVPVLLLVLRWHSALGGQIAVLKPHRND